MEYFGFCSFQITVAELCGIHLFLAFSTLFTKFCLFFKDFFVLSLGQDNAIACSMAAIKEQFRQLLCETHPSVLLRCRPLQASDVSRDHSARFNISSSFSVGTQVSAAVPLLCSVTSKWSLQV